MMVKNVKLVVTVIIQMPTQEQLIAFLVLRDMLVIKKIKMRIRKILIA